MTLIVYYLIFMIAGDFAAYFLGLLVEYELGLTGEPDRLPGPLFPFSLGVLGARDVGDQTKSGHTKCVLAGRRRQTKAWYATYEAAETAGIAIKKDYATRQVAVYDGAESVNKIIELP